VGKQVQGVVLPSLRVADLKGESDGGRGFSVSGELGGFHHAHPVQLYVASFSPPLQNATFKVKKGSKGTKERLVKMIYNKLNPTNKTIYKNLQN